MGDEAAPCSLHSTTAQTFCASSLGVPPRMQNASSDPVVNSFFIGTRRLCRSYLFSSVVSGSCRGLRGGEGNGGFARLSLGGLASPDRRRGVPVLGELYG